MERSKYHPCAEGPEAIKTSQIPSRIVDFYSILVTIAQGSVGRELGTRVAVSDIVQQTVLNALRDHSRFRGCNESQMREWLVSILRNRIVDEARKAHSLKKRNFGAEESLGNRQPEFIGPSPVANAIAREQIACLLDAIERLDSSTRAIVCARYIDGQSFRQIAQQFGLTRDTVRRRWNEALKSIRQSMDSESWK